MERDFVVGLGPALTAHRLKRLGEDLADQLTGVIAEQGLELPARGGSTLLILDQHGPLGVVEIASRLRLSHPHIIRTTRELARLGLATFKSDPADKRRSNVALTRKGSAAAAKLKSLNPSIERGYRDLFDEIGVDLVDVVDKVTRALARRGIAERVRPFLSEKVEP